MLGEKADDGEEEDDDVDAGVGRDAKDAIFRPDIGVRLRARCEIEPDFGLENCAQ